MNILWESENGYFTVTAGQGTPQITATRISAGNDFVRVTLTNACGPQRVIRFGMHAGGFSSSDYPINGPSSACKNQFVTFTTNTLPGATNYQWTWSNNMTYSSGQNTPSLTLRTGTTPGTGTVTLRVANACDAGGSATVKFLQINNCGFAIVATPNPSDGNVNISAAQPQGAATTADINQSKLYQIKIFDQSGNIKGVYNYSGGVTNINIDISSLVAGVYTIQAYNGIEYATKQIVKQ